VPSARILVPDQIEAKRAAGRFAAALAASPGVSLGHLRETSPTGLDALARAFGGGREAPSTRPPPAGVYFVINASTVELPDVEKYAAALADDPSKNDEDGENESPASPSSSSSTFPATTPHPALVLWNLELDTLRADLGLFGFPGKDLQYRFLCRFLPAFYIRPRDYSKTVPTPPFLINYSGALFRSYPGPWQVMLKQDDGAYACVAEDRLRYTLGEAKDEMAGAMGLDTGVVGGNSGNSGGEKSGENNSPLSSLLTRGVRQSTWWEDAFEEEEVHDWRR
jgi:hypothetical protein